MRYNTLLFTCSFPVSVRVLFPYFLPTQGGHREIVSGDQGESATGGARAICLILDFSPRGVVDEEYYRLGVQVQYQKRVAQAVLVLVEWAR